MDDMKISKIMISTISNTSIRTLCSNNVLWKKRTLIFLLTAINILLLLKGQCEVAIFQIVLTLWGPCSDVTSRHSTEKENKNKAIWPYFSFIRWNNRTRWVKGGKFFSWSAYAHISFNVEGLKIMRPSF